jgi:hypothetical protein
MGTSGMSVSALQLALKALGMPVKRAESLIHLAQSVIDGTFPLFPPENIEAGMKALQQRPGIGRWTANYLALRGWQAKVREELGIGHQTALELIKRARYCCMIRDLAIGESVQYLNAKKEVQNVEPTPEMSELAKAALEDVASGHASPSRSWAGITGEGTRVKKGASMKREEVDHSRNIRDGLIKLKTSLRHWKKLDPAQRAELEVIWGDVVKHVPETWLA